MASFVADASVCLPWCFADEATPYTESLLLRLAQGEAAAVAAHWPLEVLNATLQAVRRGRVSLESARIFMESLASMHILIDDSRELSRLNAIRQLAERHRLTAYDAAYLELALRLSLPLATLDKELKTAAVAENVALI
jgi:predicted nucleic acid-binding protein